LDSVTFLAGENPTDFGSNPTRTVTWTVNDGANSATQTSTVSITAINDPPTLTGVAQSILSTPATTVTLSPSVTITDPDDLDLKAAAVSIAGGTFAGAGEVPAAPTTGTNIVASYNSTTETLTLTGTDTLAHYQSVLDSVAWHATTGDPTNSNSN